MQATLLRYFVLFFLTLQPCFAFQSHDNMYFGFDKGEDFIGDISLKDFNPEDVFLVQGYADPTGDKNYNRALSKKRAEAVKRKLISQYGLKESQVKITFYGEDHSANKPNHEKRRAEVVSGTAAEIAALIDNPNHRVNAGPAIAVPDFEYPSATTDNNNIDAGLSAPLVGAAAVESTQRQHRHSIGLGVYHNILLATDRGTGAEAEWVSSENFNIEAQYQFKYKKFWFGLKGSYHIQDYEVELSPAFTWDEDTPNLLKVSFISDYEFGRWGIGFDVDYDQTSFVYEQNTNIELRDVYMFGLGLRAQYKWLQTENWSSRLGFKLDLPLTGSDDIDPEGEVGYIGFLDLEKDKAFGNYGLNLKLYYGLRNYTNDQNDQEEEAAGLLLSITSPHWL